MNFIINGGSVNNLNINTQVVTGVTTIDKQLINVMKRTKNVLDNYREREKALVAIIKDQ
jgi:hypothetical protein